MQHNRRKHDITCHKTHERLWDKWLLEITIFNAHNAQRENNENSQCQQTRVISRDDNAIKQVA